MTRPWTATEDASDQRAQAAADALARAELATLAICSPCAAGKCGRCDGSAWDPEVDEDTPCGCEHERYRD